MLKAQVTLRFLCKQERLHRKRPEVFIARHTLSITERVQCSYLQNTSDIERMSNAVSRTVRDDCIMGYMTEMFQFNRIRVASDQSLSIILQMQWNAVLKTRIWRALL